MLKSIHTTRYRQFLELLRAERLKAGVTQAKLANRIGVTQSVVSKMETGERRLDVVEVLEICDALRISQRDFLSAVVKKINRAQT